MCYFEKGAVSTGNKTRTRIWGRNTTTTYAEDHAFTAVDTYLGLFEESSKK